MEAIWDDFRRPSAPKPGMPSDPPAPTTTSAKRAPPIVGVRVQRFSAQHRKVQEWLMSQPPPPPARKPATAAPRRPPRAAPTVAATTIVRPTTTATPPAPVVLPTPARPTGIAPPPPIPVEIEPGLVFQVPHFAAHVGRKYRVRLDGRQWVVRLNHNGAVRSVRRTR